MTKIVRHGGDYRNWNVYRKAMVVCDVTEMFISRYLPKSSRTVDQMRQAARSGKQNIVEGSCAAAVSRESEIKLTGVAKASLQELLEDYRDYLRQNGLETWAPDDKRTLATRAYCAAHDDPTEFVAECKLRSAETVANIMITLICQLDFMLHKVIERAERLFIEEGGIREKMSAARREWRSKH